MSLYINTIYINDILVNKKLYLYIIAIMDSKCSLCWGKPMLTFAHIHSKPHRSNIAKLPPFFWLMNDKELFKLIHKKK